MLLVGGNPARGTYERRLEIYSPAYLFNTDNTPAVRPAITAVTPGAVGYGATFQVTTPDAAQIASVVLVRPGAATHAFDMEQRLVGLSYTAGSGVLTVTAPPNGNIAPPGYYMLFVLNAAGTPSVARFVRVTSNVPNQPPVATITSPAADVTRNPGGVGLLRRDGNGSRRHDYRVRLDVPRRQSGVELGGGTGERDLRHAGNVYGIAHGDRRPRPDERGGDAHGHRVGLLSHRDTWHHGRSCPGAARATRPR